MDHKVEKDTKIEDVYSVFSEYIKSSPYLDWVWSDKLGYLLLQISIKYRDVEECHVIEDAEELYKFLLRHVADDVFELTQNDHSIENADPLERAEIERRLKPFADQLPEYRDSYESILSELRKDQ